MAEYRLTTLNLDDECRRILGEQDNQSRYARECILRYATVVQELDDLEDRFLRLLNGSRRIADKMVQAVIQSDTIEEFIAEWLGVTETEVERMFQQDYLAHAIRAEMSHPSKS